MKTQHSSAAFSLGNGESPINILTLNHNLK